MEPMELIGISMKWECLECKAISTNVAPFWDDKTRKNLTVPKKCKCGKTKCFRLIDFNRCAYTVVPEGAKVVDTKGNIIAEG